LARNQGTTVLVAWSDRQLNETKTLIDKLLNPQQSLTKCAVRNFLEAEIAQFRVARRVENDSLVRCANQRNPAADLIAADGAKKVRKDW
jgi:hypothetical protein